MGKTYRVCKTAKDIDEFNIDRSRKDGHSYVCRDCSRQIGREYRANNYEAEKERSANYYNKNKEIVSSIRTEKRIEYAKVNKSRNAEYYTDNSKLCKICMSVKFLIDFNIDSGRVDGVSAYCNECNKAYQSAYAKNNLDKFAIKVARRSAQKIKATPEWADMDKIAKIYEEMVLLNKASDIVYHVDHIVPLRSKYVCGLHVHYNLQILTRVENSRKGNRVWPDMPELDADLEMLLKEAA